MERDNDICWWCLKEAQDPKVILGLVFCHEHTPDKTGQQLQIRDIDNKPYMVIQCPP